MKNEMLFCFFFLDKAHLSSNSHLLTLYLLLFFLLGHGKSIVDGVNGLSKTKLTQESAKQLKTADEANDDSVNRFASHSMVDGKAFSAAKECKRMLEIEGNQGVKSVIKSEKREGTRKIKEYHYWVSDPKEKLPGLKYQAPSRFTDEADGFMNLYHVYSCLN